MKQHLLIFILLLNSGSILWGQQPTPMATIKGGSYLPLYGIKDRDKTTKRVSLKSFKIDIYPVTNAQYKQFLEKYPEYRRSRLKGIFAEKKDVNIYTVNELDALAYQGYNIYKDNVIAIIDSNKEKLYAGIYEKGKLVGERFKSNVDEIISLVLEKKYKLIGDGAISYRKKIEEKGINLSLSDVFLRLNSCIFYDMLKEGILEKIDLLNLVPDYLEKSQAEKEKDGIK